MLEGGAALGDQGAQVCCRRGSEREAPGSGVGSFRQPTIGTSPRYVYWARTARLLLLSSGGAAFCMSLRLDLTSQPQAARAAAE